MVLPLPQPQPSLNEPWVQPYYVRDGQPWAIEQERQRHVQALYSMGGTIVPFMRTCCVDGCERKHKRQGLCHMHSERVRRNGTTEPKTSWRPGDTPCDVEECPNITRGGAHGFCRKHAARYRKHGSPSVVLTPSGKPVGEGEGWINANGYRVVSRVSSGGPMLEHRWIMEQALGRPLYDEETVHHRNGVKTDNRLENLELWASMHPSGQRVEDLLFFAKEVLDRYASSPAA